MHHVAPLPGSDVTAPEPPPDRAKVSSDSGDDYESTCVGLLLKRNLVTRGGFSRRRSGLQCIIIIEIHRGILLYRMQDTLGAEHRRAQVDCRLDTAFERRIPWNACVPV